MEVIGSKPARVGCCVLLLAALVACGGGGGGGDSGASTGTGTGGGTGGVAASYVTWNGNTNGTVIMDAANRQFEVDSGTRAVLDMATNATLNGLTVDSSANLLSSGTRIGYVGSSTSTSGSAIATLFCTNGSRMTITVSGGSYSYSCASGSGSGTGTGTGGTGTGGTGSTGSGSTGSGSTGSGSTGSGSGTSTASFSQNETSEINGTLTGSQPNFVDNGGLTLTQTTRVWAFSWAEYAAAFWAVDAANAQRLKAGQSFTGYPLAPAGQAGMNYVTLPAGTWYVGVVPNQSISSTYSNRIYAELAVTTLDGATEVNDVGMVAGGNPGAWNSQGFTISQGVRAFIETEGAGGTFAVMDSSQFSSFQSANANGFRGGSIAYTYACGGTSGGASLEIECELKLPPGTYYLVYINTESSKSGGAANIGYFQ